MENAGFCFTAESGIVGKEIGKCIDLADAGVHAVLFVLSVRTSFSKEEQAAIQYFKKLFGTKITDYMIVVFTGGDKLEDNDSLNDHLDHSCPEDLKVKSRSEIYCLMYLHHILWNKLTDSTN